MFKYTIIKMLKTNQIKIMDNDWIETTLNNSYYKILDYANNYQEAFKKVKKFRESEV
jgi:hypothetical protein